MKSKEIVREEIRRKLKNQDPEEARRHSRRIHAALYRLEAFRKSRRLLIYLSMPLEVDTLAVVKKCLSSGKRVIVPRVNPETGELDLQEIRDLESCVPTGPLGLLEPRPGTGRPVRPEEVDCAVLPGLAFDGAGRRLGRGRGYFDRLLGRIGTHTPVVALAFPFQVIDEVPTGPGDRPVDCVLSS